MNKVIHRPGRRRAELGLLLAAAALLCASSPARAAEYRDLPPPPQVKPNISEAIYYLTIVVNGRNDSGVVPVAWRDGNYYVEAAVLRRNHVRLNATQNGAVNVNRLEQVKTEYNASQQQLALTVPTSWLPEQNLQGDGGAGRIPSQSSPGLLFNYDAYYSSPRRGDDALTSWLEQRFFNDYGILSNSGTLTNSRDGNRRDGYLRYDTSWRYSDSDKMISYQAGDIISNSLTWSNSVRMGGLRIGRNFAIRPDVVTYPLIQYNGSAALPGTLDLFINGYKASSNALNPGPFTLTNVPYINGAGEATVVTTDALGRQVSTSVPFYVSNQLLRAGLSDFDLSLGALRKDYGVKNAAYTSQPAASAIYRYGLNNALTLSGHGETVDDLYLLGAGADFTVGHWGTVSSSFSHSERNAPGNQYSLGYSYYASLFSLSLQHMQRTSGYRDLTSWQYDSTMSRQVNQATFSSQIFGPRNGTLGIGYFDVQARDRSRTRLTNLSYSRALWGNSTMYLALNKTLGSENYSAQLQLIIPLSIGGNVNTGVQRNSEGRYTTRVGMSKSAPSEGGIGWNAAWSEGSSDYRQASLTWRAPYATLQGGAYGERGDINAWADASGSLIYMAGALFPSNRINDAFIVVDTGGYPDVPVRYENRSMGTTNKRGHLLVPWVNANYPAKVEIDPLQLPADVETPKVEARVAVKEGSGMLVSFPVERVLSANIVLHNGDEQPIAPGTPVTNEDNGESTLSGHQGLVYFSHLRNVNHLRFRQQDGHTCRATFSLPDTSRSMARVGPLTCDKAQ
ncbi:fimbrial biogenesis outer membrane usher protein [Affinibrenneria salicis]|uniref:Fimbrial biogenesis outer membrane usher protein n=2 Tax=Affinibrenneria salicis TaxID=2590031 RepID=A0A5J5FU88_9GAMM|nr:fimbrial biogenesis outer membrane usher protein [Affinibrenneria salicis]